MDDPVIAALQLAIETKQKELVQLQAALRNRELETLNGPRKRRNRKKTGFQKGSVPFLVHEILKNTPAPLAASALAEELTKRGKKMESRFVAAGIARYIPAIFDRTAEGAYFLVK